MKHSARRPAIGFFCLLCFCLPNWNEFFTIARAGVPESKSGEKVSPVRDADASASAFRPILPVLRHPRCMNCHSSGDFPKQGDDNHPHAMHIRQAHFLVWEHNRVVVEWWLGDRCRRRNSPGWYQLYL